MTNKQAKKYSDNLKKEHDQKLNQMIDDYDRKKKILENKIAKKQSQAKTKDDLAKLDKELEVGQNNIINELAKDLTKLTTDVKENTPKKIIERVNYDEEVKKKNEVEQDVRSHLRGFSRTIPSFIMAYGDKNLNLRNFDDYTEDDVFEEVTGITEEQFRFLRDGGDYTDQESEQKVLQDLSLDTVGKIRAILGVLPEGYRELDLRQLYQLKERYPEVYEKVKSRLETGWESTISLLEQGISEGKIRNIKIPILKTMMEATLEQFFQRDVLVQNGISYHEALDEVVSILIDGITI